MVFKEKNVKVHEKIDKKRRECLNNLKPGWVGPDGGWGWIVVVACGLSNVFAVMICVGFGLVFRERLHDYGISPSQITTIMNVNAAVGSFSGLMNGPLYKRFTFRQVASVAGFVCSGSICALPFMKTFSGLLFFYSFLYGISSSVVMAASALALIPYFTKKRRIAVGISWGFSGTGNILIPQIATLLMSIYGSFGSIIIIGGIALHTIVCAVLLQPVQMNAKRSTEYEKMKIVSKDHDEKSTDAVINGSRIIIPIENDRNGVKYNDEIEKRLSQRFGVQYIHKNGDDNELEIPLMTCTEKNGQISDVNKNENWKWKNTMDMNDEAQVGIINKSEKSDDMEKNDNNSYEIVRENNDNIKYILEKSSSVTCQKLEDQKQKKLSWWSNAIRAVIVFFDLDLLRDFACLNIMIGVSLGFIIEINFLILIPFILADYGLADNEIAVIMSVGGCIDVFTRLSISVLATRIGWANRTFMLIGIGLSALGHGALAHVNTYNMILVVIISCSMGKAMCFVFSALVLPDYVSLEKLPAASGLQLMIRGILFLAFAPSMGWLRQTTGSYRIPLHFLNIFSYYVIISGIIENWIRFSKRNQTEKIKEARA